MYSALSAETITDIASEVSYRSVEFGLINGTMQQLVNDEYSK